MFFAYILAHPLPRKLMQYLTKGVLDRTEDSPLAPLRNKDDVTLTVPLRVSKAPFRLTDLSVVTEGFR